jgi:tripartite-type tricarboxylate transporter receptor subunit TctC
MRLSIARQDGDDGREGLREDGAMQGMFWRGLLIAAVAGVTAAAPAGAETVEEFYRGKQISLIIPSGVGGGYDLYGRFLSRHIGKHIPGTPTVVVRNMPGAGGIVAANHLANVAAPDGLTIALLQNTITLNQLAKMASVKFDVRKFGWLGNMSISSSICALSGPAKDVSGRELFEKEVLIGTSTGSTSMVPALLNNLAGTRLKLVRGYPASNAVVLAMEKGEVNGLCGWSWDGARVNARDMLARGVAKVALDINIQPQDELRDLGVPFLMDLLPEGENKEVLKVILSTQMYNRPFAAPPDVPADRLKALREAFVAALKDPDMVAEGEKLKIDVQYLPPERIVELIDLALGAPAHIQQRAVEELGKAGWGG